MSFSCAMRCTGGRGSSETGCLRPRRWDEGWDVSAECFSGRNWGVWKGCWGCRSALAQTGLPCGGFQFLPVSLDARCPLLGHPGSGQTCDQRRRIEDCRNVQQRAITFVSLDVFESWPRCTCLYVQQFEPAKRRAMLNCRGASKYIAHASSTCLLECPTRLEMLIVYSHTKRIRN